MNTAVISGVGPDRGMGARLAHRFASHGLHVFVAGRTAEKLEAVADAIRAGGASATAVVADATVEADTQRLFAAAEAVGPVEVAIYNTGNNTPGTLVDMEAEYFEQAWRVCCLGGFLFGREALRLMQPRAAGTILFTGASASLRGKAGFGAFNAGKAALRTFAQALAKEAGGLGIHVGHVVIDGAIDGEKIHSRLPEYAERLGEAGMLDIEAIVDAYEYLWRQSPRGWSFEIDVRTAIESW